jgi:hypothetical protein
MTKSLPDVTIKSLPDVTIKSLPELMIKSLPEVTNSLGQSDGIFGTKRWDLWGKVVIHDHTEVPPIWGKVAVSLGQTSDKVW